MSLTPRFPVETLSPPVPVEVTWSEGAFLLTITFDKPLVDQPTAVLNWTLTTQGESVLSPDAVYVVPSDQVQLEFPFGTEPAEIAYAATPPDVVGAPPNGLEVAAFTLPVTV